MCVLTSSFCEQHLLPKESTPSNEKMEKESTAAELSRRLRKHLGGLTQHELAERLQVSRNYISHIEAGLKIPSARLCSQMTLLLNSTVSKASNVEAVQEEQSAYGADPAAEIRAQLERLLVLAANDRAKLGWISHQMHAHLAPPAHWFSAAQRLEREEARQRAIDEAKARMPELRDPPRPAEAKEKAG